MNRLTAMRLIAWLLIASGVGFSLFTVIFAFVGPNQEIHAVHNAVVTSLIMVLTLPPLVAVARRPGESGPELLILAALTVAGIVAMAVSLTPDPFILPVLVLIAVVWSLAPSRKVPGERGDPSFVMLGLVIAATVLLAPYALENAALQRSDQTSEHARFFHWVETAFYAGGIIVVGILGAWRPGTFRLAAWCAGAGLAVLGTVSVLFAERASALASPWSWLALAGGVAFIGVGEWEAARTGA